jgi:hypothetical protein
MMMGLEVIERLAQLGADAPVNLVIKEEDKYYDIDYITFDDEIHEFIIVAKEGTGSTYSTRGHIHEY